MKTIKFTALILAIALALSMTTSASASGTVTVDYETLYGSLTLSPDFTAIHYPQTWDLTQGDLVLSYTLDMTSITQPAPWATSYTEVGIRQVGGSDFNPGPWDTYQGGEGGWMTSLVGDLTPSPGTQSLHDKHNLSASGGRGELDYDTTDPNTVSSPLGSYTNYGIWFDRDGVDPYQATYWGAVDGGTYNTGGVYTIVITYHAISSSLGTMFATINGIPTGFYAAGWVNAEPDYYPAGLSFTGDTTQMQVFAGLWAPDGSYGNLIVSNLTSTGYPASYSTVWVDDDWTGTLPGTEVESGKFFGFNAFATVQDGVDQVDAGGTVYVAAGTYDGQINVNKSVTILGDPGDASAGPGPGAPVIDGGSLPGDAFLIANGVSNVTIQGFEIRNFTSNDTGIGNGISAWVGSTSNITIQDNYFHNLGYNGVLVGNDKNSDPSKWGDHTNWTIKGNILETFEAYGFELTNASNSSIENNIIHSNATWNLAATGIMVDARRNESGIVIKGNQIDGEMWPGYPAIYVFANSFETPNVNLNDVLIEENIVSTTSSTGTAQVMVYNYPGTGTVTGVQIHNNSLSTFRNGTPVLIDASANWWGSNVPATVKTAANGGLLVDYTPWLNSGTDTALSTAGFQGDFSYLNVDDDSPQTGTTMRIQEGVNSVSGSTVHVVAGTYVEQVVIGADLTIFGDGAATTFIQAPSVLTNDPDGAKTIVLFTGPITAEFSGFTVQGPVNGLNFGIYVRDGATANIHDNTIKDIRDEPLSGNQYGYAIEVGKYNNTFPFVNQIGHATITNNTVYGYQKTGIECEGAGSSATITGNTVTGAGLIPTTSQNGIQIRRGATGSITNNVVTGNAYTGHEVNATGIAVTYPGNDVLIQGNIVNYNTANIYTYQADGVQILDNQVSDAADGRIVAGITADSDFEATASVGITVTISGNSVKNNLSGGSHQGPGIFLWGVKSGTVSGNEIEGSGDDGILIGASGNITITNNLFSGNGLLVTDPNAAAIDFGGVIPELESYGFWPNPLGGFSVHNNSIAGNLNGIWNYDSDSVNANTNWWGAVSGPGIVGPGTGDKVSANVDFDPWLCYGTDTDPAIGFQPNPATSPCVGTVTIIKDATPADGTNFEFGEFNGRLDPFFLDDANPDDGDGITNSQTFTNLVPGPYMVIEQLPVGWDLTSISCDDNDSTGDLSQHAANINLQAGESVICTFTNVRPTGSITITKLADAAGTFNFSGPSGNFSLNSGGITTFNNLAPGAYAVTESDPAPAFYLTGLVCNDANSTVDPASRTASIQLEAGENVTCTFTNTKANPKIAVDKQEPVIATGGGPLTYTYKVTNPGNVPLSNVAVSDNKCSPVNYGSGDNSNNLLDPGETWTFTCTYTPSFTSSKLTNKATVTGKYGTTTYTATDSATLYPFTLKKKIYLYWDERSSRRVVYSPPDNTPFTVEIYKNNALISTITISQNAPGKLWLSNGTYTFKEVSVPPGYLAAVSSFTYTTMDGHGSHNSCHDNDRYNEHDDDCDDGRNLNEWTYPNVIRYNLAIDKTGPATAHKGATITYNYTVTNSGPASVRPKVTDDKCSYVTYVSGDTDYDGRVDPGETWNFQCKYKVTASIGSKITNKATVSDADQPKSWEVGGDINTSNNKDTWTLTVIK